MPTDAKEELARLTPDAFASKYLLECVPHIFGGDSDSHIAWKAQLGEALDVDPRAIAIIGSACVGISLNPGKGLKPFGPKSDVDIAIVSQYHFEVAWRRLRSLKAGARLRLDRSQVDALTDHRTRLIYWGTVATDRVLTLLPFGKAWLLGLNGMARVEPTAGRDIKARIYRDFESLRAYQLLSVERSYQRSLEATEGAS
jgi:hypothetical protein